MQFDEVGNLQKSNVYIVCGAPASGKTTYVRNHIVKGDLVVDVDLIKQAISMCDKTNAPDNLLEIALGIRDYIYTQIKIDRIQCKNIWIIASLPSKEEREQLQYRFQANMIFVYATKAECIERAMNDPERTDKEKQIMLIEKWFLKFTDI